jgi:integrase
MASFQKRGLTWRAIVRRAGETRSATFSTKAEAVGWAAKTESAIISGKNGKVPDKPFADLLQHYLENVSVHKRSARWEQFRINVLLRDPLSQVSLQRLSASDFAAWRDRRLRVVSAASVRREWNLLTHACTLAVREWKWLESNPMRDVRRPEEPPPRDRLFSCWEIEAILTALGFEDGVRPDTVSARVGCALLFALETGMRCGEICALNSDDLTETVAEVRKGKTRAATRRTPLSPYARELLKLLEGESGSVFRLQTSQVDALFRKARDRCGIVDLHFHDSRATAITRLARKLDILSLARMIGHRDIKMLQIYYRESAEDLAERL